MTERYVGLNIADEEFYIIDSSALNRNKKWFEEKYSEEDDFEQVIEDEWCQYLYENSMSGLEIINKLNEQEDELNHLSNFGLHVILDKKNKEIRELEQRIKELEIELNTYKRKFLDCVDRKMGDVK